VDALHQKRVEQGKKKTSGLKNTNGKKADESWNLTQVHHIGMWVLTIVLTH